MITINLWRVLFLSHVFYQVNCLATPFNEPSVISTRNSHGSESESSLESRAGPPVNDQTIQEFLNGKGGNPLGLQRYQHRSPTQNFPLTAWNMHLEFEQGFDVYNRIIQNDAGFAVLGHMFQETVKKQYPQVPWGQWKASGITKPGAPTKVFLVAFDNHLWGFSSIIGGGKRQETHAKKKVRRYTYYEAMPNNDPTKKIFYWAANGYNPQNDIVPKHVNKWSCAEIHAMRVLNGEYGNMGTQLANAQGAPQGMVVAPNQGLAGFSGNSEAPCSGDNVGCREGIAYVNWMAPNFQVRGSQHISYDQGDFNRIRAEMGLSTGEPIFQIKTTREGKVFATAAQGNPPPNPNGGGNLPDVPAAKKRRRSIEQRAKKTKADDEDFAESCQVVDFKQMNYKSKNAIVYWQKKPAKIMSAQTKPKMGTFKVDKKFKEAELEAEWKKLAESKKGGA